MDSNITCRFFKIEAEFDTVPPFEEACLAAFELGDDPEHRQKLVGGATVRMERFGKDANFFRGEAVRVQTENIPPEASPKGLTPLAVGGLGHAIAFRYHPGLKVIAIQFDNRAVSLGRLLNYLRVVDGSHLYKMSPLVTEDAWDRYDDGKPRKFLIQIAAPANLEQVEGEVGVLTDGARQLGEIADAPMITIEVSMGQRRKGFLDSDFVTGALNYFTKGAGKDEDIRKLSATVGFLDDSGSEAIDFLNEKLVCKDVLELPKNDADAHYQRRDSFLKNLPILRTHTEKKNT